MTFVALMLVTQERHMSATPIMVGVEFVLLLVSARKPVLVTEAEGSAEDG